ncbi:TetR/AcrR family transcriptional regulator [Caulobacter sp. KR2-114]|uniref:TetR/AcrR family transcriptional regulator n=1 Tax=Caulobacter sp. KR2-114 TaxID=3400912 RepID=UPI003C0A6F84
MASARARRQDAAGTVDDLLATAERLFAEQGVENVALTAIVAESGQKNRSALHYHFGSRAGVLEAVLDRRLAPINARRHALLAAADAEGGVLAIVRADIAALGQTVVEEPWGPDYLSILAQVTFHPQLLGERQVRGENLSGLRLARARIEAAAAAGRLPARLIARRMEWMRDSVVFAMARWVRDTPPAQRTAAGMATLVEDLATYGAAGLLAAPPDQPPVDKKTIGRGPQT